MIPLVAVVDDDFSVRESLESLIRSVGMSVTVFASAEDRHDSLHMRRPLLQRAQRYRFAIRGQL